MTAVTVLGLGTMGGRIARVLAIHGHDVRGFDPVEAAREVAASSGVAVTARAEDAVNGAALIVMSVPRPEHVLETARGALASARGAVVANLSTIDPGTAREAAQILDAAGVRYVDAPVLGRPDRIGGWTLPAGGAQADIEEVGAVLVPSVAKSVVRVGDVGAGSVVKLLNNLMFGAINAATAEAVAACRLAGVDPDVFVRTLADSGAATVSNLFREIGPKMVSGDYSPAFSLDLLAKDNRLAAGLLREIGASSPITDLIVSVNADALELGHGGDDTSAVHELYRTRSVAP